MVAFPGCKINLGLHILHRRSDGFHEIDTAFFPVPWTDALEVLPADEFSFSFSGLTVPGSAEDNLCLQAYRLISRDFTFAPVQGHLHKVVPMGAGLGGGSADAAHTLRLLSSIASLEIPQDQLRAYSLQLGSDCSFFLMDGPARGRGRGEILEPLQLTLKGYFLVIVAPPIHVSTAEAYAQVKPKTPNNDLSEVLNQPVTEWRNLLVNDFEPSVFARHPELTSIKNRLYERGAVYAAMSGSGSSVFGIFAKEMNREEAFPAMPGWSGWL